jgi:c-di-GMP-binding flagellar brake protein YcgR
VELIHAREARYRLRCPVRSVRPLPPGDGGGVVVVLGHDEAPARRQAREWARVPLELALDLVPLAPAPALAPERSVRATTEDLSAGGALVACAPPLPVGALLAASFTLSGERFEAVRTVVVGSEPRAGGPRAHLEFGPMAEAERERLVLAVERAARRHAVSGASRV